MYVQEVIKTLHKRKTPALFIKLDISKAFDSGNWPYLLDILSHLGFGLHWRNWIAALWCVSSSAFLLNGEPGKKILHCKGVRQGDPLSLMLFLLAMEPLNLLFKKAQECGLLGKLSSVCDMCRIFSYADDATLFINPTKDDLIVTYHILSIFAQASGLVTNMSKTQYFPIRYGNVVMDLLTSVGRIISAFPCLYSGLPLNTRKPTRASF
jgi:hypothetical protein